MKKYRQLSDFYIEEDEEELVDVLVPQYYVDENIEKINVDYAIRFLQNELNYLLNSFLNGGFSNKGFVLYPLVKDVSMDKIVRLKRLKKIAVLLNSNSYDFTNSIKKYDNSINSENSALILSALYKDLSNIKNKNGIKIKKERCKELDIDKYKKSDLSYLKPLKELKNYANKNLKLYLSGFYLHGSLATNDFIKGWSDVDTISIVSKNTINNYKFLLELRDKLYRTRHFFYKIDSLQHHGSIIICEYDLENYCQSYFPVPIFKYSKSFFKDDKIIDFKVRDYSREAVNRLFWFINYFRKLNIENKFNMGIYETKNLLHIITLFPTIYLQAKGKIVYKKFSFEIARKEFDKEKWKVIDGVSSIRYNWKNSNEIPLFRFYSKINPLLYCQLNSKFIDLFRDIKRQNNINVRDIIKNMYNLSEDAWSGIKKNARL